MVVGDKGEGGEGEDNVREESEPLNQLNGKTKTSSASITLKSATLPRRKLAHSEIQLDIKPSTIVEQPIAMRFNTEMQHPVADMRSTPPARDRSIQQESPFSPLRTTTLGNRATSLEPKEHIIPIQRPGMSNVYARTASNATTIR